MLKTFAEVTGSLLCCWRMFPQLPPLPAPSLLLRLRLRPRLRLDLGLGRIFNTGIGCEGARALVEALEKQNGSMMSELVLGRTTLPKRMWLIISKAVTSSMPMRSRRTFSFNKHIFVFSILSVSALGRGHNKDHTHTQDTYVFCTLGIFLIFFTDSV